MLLDDMLTYIDTQSTKFTKFAGTSGNLGKAIILDASFVPNTFVALYETQGLPSGYTFSTGSRAGVAYESPRLQVLSRSTKYATARNNAETIYTLIDGLGNVLLPTSTGTRYLSIEAVQAPFSAGRDEGDRWIVSTNFDVMKEVG